MVIDAILATFAIRDQPRGRINGPVAEQWRQAR
jgi:hypothetical protein